MYLGTAWKRLVILFLACGSITLFAYATEGCIEKSAVWDGTVATAFSSGSGSDDDPYVISDGTELALFAKLTNGCEVDADGILFADKNYKLSADIVLNQSFDIFSVPDNLNEWVPIASAYVPITIETAEDYTHANAFYGAVYNERGVRLWSAGEALNLAESHCVRAAFRGTFDGNGFSIDGMYVSTELEVAGLFGYVWGGTIENVVIKNACVTNPNKDPFSFSGIAAGKVETYSKTPAYISNCFIGNSYVEGGRVGGIAGIIGGGTKYLPTVENCVVDIAVNGLVQDNAYAGGVFGDAACYAKNCFVRGNVHGYRTVGGFAGWQEVGDTSFTNCLSHCVVSASETDGDRLSIGGFIGKNEYDVRLTNCFWLQTKAANPSFEESDLYGYAVDETGKLVTAGDVFLTENIFEILNEWVFTNCSSQQLLWLDSAKGIELSNISIERLSGKDEELFLRLHIKNQLYLPTHIGRYRESGQMIDVKLIDGFSCELVVDSEGSDYKLFSIDDSFRPVCNLKSFSVV